MKDAFQQALDWYCSHKISTTHEHVSETRDIFQARLDRMYHEFGKLSEPVLSISLLVAIAGEIGNNSFDHNLGQWQDGPGCYFQFGYKEDKVWVIIADRGQGIFSSLKRVVPELKNDQKAIEMAFEKRISGRSPEKRGNGLKFVRQVMNGNPHRGLYVVSGEGKLVLGGLGFLLEKKFSKILVNQKGQGVFTFIEWDDKNEN